MNSSTRFVYKSCRSDEMSALKLTEIMLKSKLVAVVVLCFFIYEARNFWNNPHIMAIKQLLMLLLLKGLFKAFSRLALHKID